MHAEQRPRHLGRSRNPTRALRSGTVKPLRDSINLSEGGAIPRSAKMARASVIAASASSRLDRASRQRPRPRSAKPRSGGIRKPSRRCAGGRAVLAADPVEQHFDGLRAESAGERLAVVGQDLVGDPRPAKRGRDHGAHGLGRRLRDEAPGTSARESPGASTYSVGEVAARLVKELTACDRYGSTTNDIATGCSSSRSKPNAA
jgi:hypothetical protein